MKNLLLDVTFAIGEITIKPPLNTFGGSINIAGYLYPLKGVAGIGPGGTVVHYEQYGQLSDKAKAAVETLEEEMIDIILQRASNDDGKVSND